MPTPMVLTMDILDVVYNSFSFTALVVSVQKMLMDDKQTDHGIISSVKLMVVTY